MTYRGTIRLFNTTIYQICYQVQHDLQQAYMYKIRNVASK